jgi:inosine-uridine nucleoside N-ribohydrolase
MDSPEPGIPVILDTDIGSDIDDTWALAMLLQSPELDLRLVVSDFRDTHYRAKLLARMLEVAGRTDVPVAVGIRESQDSGPQEPWVSEYDLDRYPGTVHTDGVQTLIDTLMAADEPMTLLCIGPLPNIDEALRREPRIAERCRFVGMHGSIYRGYEGGAEPAAEWNVRANPAACRAAFTAPWPMTITPLDTCGIVTLDGARYAAVRDSDNPLLGALMENYRFWAAAHNRAGDAETRSSILFDTVAVYLAFAEELLEIETLGIRIDDEGYTRIDPAAKPVRCAVRWKDLDAYKDFLVDRLLGRA